MLERKHFWRSAALAVGLMCGLAHPAAAADTIEMKLGTATINGTETEWLNRYAAAVNHDSGGRIKATVYQGSQLGSIPRMIEGTQFGAIQGWLGPAEFLAGVDQRYQVLTAPSVFTSMPQFRKTLLDRAFRNPFLRLGAEKGLKGVALFVNGEMGLVTRKPVRKAADLKGMKIRATAGNVQEIQMRLLGATAIPMPLDQVLPALQQGSIDGVLASLPVVAAMRYYDVAKSFTNLDAAYVADITVLSKSWFDKLPADLQTILVRDAAQIDRTIYPSYTEPYIVEQRKVWTNGGGELIDFTPAERDALLATLAPVGADAFKSKPDVLRLYNQLVTVAGHNR